MNNFTDPNIKEFDNSEETKQLKKLDTKCDKERILYMIERYKKIENERNSLWQEYGTAIK